MWENLGQQWDNIGKENLNSSIPRVCMHVIIWFIPHIIAARNTIRSIVMFHRDKIKLWDCSYTLFIAVQLVSKTVVCGSLVPTDIMGMYCATILA